MENMTNGDCTDLRPGERSRAHGPRRARAPRPTNGAGALPPAQVSALVTTPPAATGTRTGISSPATNRSRGVRSRSVRAAVLVVLALAGLFLGAGTARASTAETVKVFVVPDNGQSITLQAVASAFLGDAGRAQELFELNVGLSQSDGATLSSVDEVLHPGWIMRLPDDASGTGVQEAQDSRGEPTGSSADSGSDSEDIVISLRLFLAGVVAFLLGLLTVVIVARRRIAGMASRMMASVDRLREPARRRQQLAQRRSITQAFSADQDSTRRAYQALEDFTPRPGVPERPVHAVRVDDTGVTAWLTVNDAATSPWRNLDATRWYRPADAATVPIPREEDPTLLSSVPPCLVRAGQDGDGRPVFVDLTRLDGVLSITGPVGHARQVLENLLVEIGRSWPGLPVSIVTAQDGTPPPVIPTTFGEVTQADPGDPDAGDGSARGAVRAAAARRQVRGVAVLSRATGGSREAAELNALGRLGWTVLACGPVEGAHWTWEVDDRGVVHLPVLGLQVTAPA